MATDTEDTALFENDRELEAALAILDDARRKVEDLKRQSRGKTIAAIKEKIRLFDLTPEDLGFISASPDVPLPSAPSMVVAPKASADRRSQVQPKFIGPAGEKWSGRGRDPNWLRDLVAAGNERETYRV